jgi:hypothetical protein
MRKYFLSVFLILLLYFVALPASAFTYEFYHVAFRDYNGNGTMEADDHVRYGFKMTNNDGTWPDLTNWRVRADVPYEGSIASQYANVGGGSPYMSAFNSQTYSEDNYWSAKFGSQLSVDMVAIHLADPDWNIMHSHQVSLPSLPASTYNGFDANSVTWVRDNGGWLFSWDGIASPSTEESSYRFSLSNWGDVGHEILFSLDVGQTELLLSDDLLSVANSWVLQFQQRFANPDDTVDNSTWLRSYGAPRDISLSAGPVPTPLPGAAWLMGSGLVGLISIRRKYQR